MPTVQDTAKLLDLKKKLESLSAAEQLRVCAGLIEKGQYDLAETITGNVVDALRARRLFGAKV